MMPDSGTPVDEQSGVEERPQNRREWSGFLRSLAVPALIVATVVGALWYIDRRGEDGAAGDGRYGVVALPAELNTTGKSPGTDAGRTPPDFLLQTVDGGELRFSDLRGKPLLVNFWASWCTPCRQEMPDIVRAASAYRARGLVVIAVNLQEDDGRVRGFAADFGMDFAIPMDRTGQVGGAWRIGGPFEGIPSSYFIDAAGVVRARRFGPMTAEMIAGDVAAVLQ